MNPNGDVAQRTGPDSGGPARINLSDVCGELVGHRVAVRAHISGESGVKAVFSKLKSVCSRCGAEGVYDASTDSRRLYRLMVGETIGQTLPENEGTCGESGKPHYWTVIAPVESPLTYQSVLLRDTTVQDEPSSGATAGSQVGGYLLGKVPQIKDVELEGTLVVNPRNSDIELLADVVRQDAPSIDSFDLKPDEVGALRSYFSTYSDSLRSLEFLASKCNPRIVGREQAKLAVILAYLSPTWIDVSGQLRPGTMRVMLFGDPRLGKGSVEDYLRQKLGLGKHAIGETSSRTGITYAIDSERGMVVWGVMVEADRGLVVLEALHKFPAEDLATMRETLSKLYVEVRRSFSARAWARTRVVADSNSRQEMALYPYPCMALRELPCFKDSADLTRWDLAIPFKAGDVDPDRIADIALQGVDDPWFLSNFKMLTLWAWSRNPRNIRFDDGAFEEVKEAYKDLLARYAVSEIPVVNEDSLISLLRISAAFAALTFSTSDGVTLEVEAEHVRLAKEFLEEVLEMLEIEDYKIMHGELPVTEEDRKEYASLIRRSELASKTIEALVRGPRNSPDLAEETAHEAPSVRRICSELKAMGVVEKASRGYRLTKNGVQLWKEFHVTKVTEVTEKRAPPSPSPTSTGPPRRPAFRNSSLPPWKPSVTLLTDDDGK
jgi:DNA replicative helicase MCM subunit Mcm2 (Cdc46/Mcm family)